MEQIPEILSKEYFAILQIVGNFDARLLTIKGWGITFSLATLVLAIQQKSRGLFLAVVVSSICFWLLEGTIKGHQMRYYPRMNEIEHSCSSEMICPMIDTSWNSVVPKWLKSTLNNNGEPSLSVWYWFRWFLPHVMFPHIITMLTGLWFLFSKQDKKGLIILDG